MTSDRKTAMVALTNDPLHFETLYRQNYEFVWRTLRRMGTREADMLDACQKVFLIAFKRLPEFEGRSSVKTWLCGIALRVATAQRRSAPARRERPFELSLTQEGIDPDQFRALEQKERLRELHDGLAQLSEEQRVVFVLFELEEMSGEQIAEILEIPEGTVRSRLRLARQAFSRIVNSRRDTDVEIALGGEP